MGGWGLKVSSTIISAPSCRTRLMRSWVLAVARPPATRKLVINQPLTKAPKPTAKLLSH